MDDPFIIHNLELYLTVLSEFGLIAESKLLPPFDEYMNIHLKLKISDRFTPMPDSSLEKHLLILVDGYANMEVAREEYFAYVKAKEASNEQPCPKIHEIYTQKMSNKSVMGNKWMESMRLNQPFLVCKKWMEKIKQSLNNPKGMGAGITIFFLVLVLLWIKKNVPRFWSRMLASGSLLAYSLLAPI